MNEPKQYSNPLAWWRAATDRAKTAARDSSRTAPQLLREFVYDRMLTRVFADSADAWVSGDDWILKGGTALLARVDDARHSKDVDLLNRLANINDAVDQLRAALARDGGDPLRFEITKTEQMSDGDGQPGVAGRKVTVEVWAATKRVERFHIDVVTGSVMTTQPQILSPRRLVDFPGLPNPTYRLYPVVDHVADKVCATETLYSGRPSSRVRDLVDIIVIARTQTFTLGDLRSAIHAERVNRGIPLAQTFELPADWATRYPSVAAATPLCDGIDFTAAATIAQRLVGRALITDEPAGKTWRVEALDWTEDAEGERP